MSLRRVALFGMLALVPEGLRAQGVAAQAGGNIQAVAAIPLASYAQGQAMMAEAARRAALLDVSFTFLDKEYKDDTYATDPLGNKYRTGCYRFKVHSGFRFKVDVPQFTLTPQGLTVVQNISKINADGLNAKGQVVACHDIAYGVGIRLSDVKVTYTARPMISFNQSNGACTIGWNQDTDDVTVSIGDLNILGVQNNLDQLAKKAVTEAVNLTFDGFVGAVMRNELMKVSVGVCGSPGSKKR